LPLFLTHTRTNCLEFMC